MKKKNRINALLERHQPREEEKEKEMVVLSEKEKKISIKTEAASSSMKTFEKRPVEYEEENMKSLAPILKQNMKKWILKKKKAM